MCDFCRREGGKWGWAERVRISKHRGDRQVNRLIENKEVRFPSVVETSRRLRDTPVSGQLQGWAHVHSPRCAASNLENGDRFRNSLQNTPSRLGRGIEQTMNVEA